MLISMTNEIKAIATTMKQAWTHMMQILSELLAINSVMQLNSRYLCLVGDDASQLRSLKLILQTINGYLHRLHKVLQIYKTKVRA